MIGPRHLALAVALLLAAPAEAAVAATWTASLKDAGASLWEGATSMVSGLFGWMLPGRPDLSGPMRHDRFWALIGAAGYGMKEFHTSIGLIPSAGSTVQLVREMSDADCEEFERQLEAFEREDGGLVARFQRMVVLAMLDAQAATAYKVDRVELSLLPLPQATFHLSPVRTLLNEEHDTLLRAIEALKSHFP